MSLPSAFETLTILFWGVLSSTVVLLAFDALQNNREPFSLQRLLGRWVPLREASHLLNLPVTLGFAVLCLGSFAMLLIFAFLQGLIFATVMVVVFLLAFSLSGRSLTRLNAGRRLRKLEQQLPITIDQLIGLLRSGRTLSQAIADVPPVLTDPAALEMFEISDRAQRGLSLDESLTLASEKYQSKNYGLFLAILRVFLRQGGNVVDPLQRMSGAFKELVKADDQIKTASTEGRAIFFIITGAILFIFGFVSLASPRLIAAIFENVAGILAFSIGLLLTVGGGWMLFAMTKVRA